MRLSLDLLRNPQNLGDYKLPMFDIEKMRKNTIENPTWLHFGAGNIFRAYPAVLCQELLNLGELDKGIICCETYDEEIIEKAYKAFDDLSISVTLNADGSVGKQIVASVAESFYQDASRLEEIFLNPSLQMISFTITEKGYGIDEKDLENSPENAKSLWGKIVYLCVKRLRENGQALTFLSMDNCAKNGKVLKNAVISFAKAYKEKGYITTDEYRYFEEKLSFPWSTIDKITPRPDESVSDMLKKDGFSDMEIIKTAKNSFTAGFVNAEKAQYLIIEDKFLNGKAPLDKAGVIFTDRDTVNAFESMKVGTCLNPLHTALAIFGILLGYTSISDEMADKDLLAFLNNMVEKESMPVVVDPKIISPKAFLNEVLNERFVNPFLKDTPQRIATDTSMKLSVRFGQTLKKQIEIGCDIKNFTYIPMVFAAWLRYLLEIDDSGKEYKCSPDPKIAEIMPTVKSVGFKNTATKKDFEEIFKRDDIWGVDLIATGLDEKVLDLFNEMNNGTGSVRKNLTFS